MLRRHLRQSLGTLSGARQDLLKSQGRGCDAKLRFCSFCAWLAMRL
jgi:hypothetical protein